MKQTSSNIFRICPSSFFYFQELQFSFCSAIIQYTFQYERKTMPANWYRNIDLTFQVFCLSSGLSHKIKTLRLLSKWLSVLLFRVWRCCHVMNWHLSCSCTLSSLNAKMSVIPTKKDVKRICLPFPWKIFQLHYLVISWTKTVKQKNMFSGLLCPFQNDAAKGHQDLQLRAWPTDEIMSTGTWQVPITSA